MADTDGGTAVLDAPATDVAATATESSTPAVAAAPASAEATEAAASETAGGEMIAVERDDTGRFKAKTDYSSVILPRMP